MTVLLAMLCSCAAFITITLGFYEQFRMRNEANGGALIALGLVTAAFALMFWNFALLT